MKNSALSRREFLRDLGAGVLSTTVLATAAPTPGSGSAPASLPPLFDCNKYLGKGFPERPDFPQVADLLRHLDRLGIDRAVVWHTAARDVDPIAGNEQLIREVFAADARDRLFPSFVITPSLAGDAGAMDRFLALVTDHRVRAFHFLPGRDGPSIREIAPAIRRLGPAKPVLFLNCLESLGRNSADIPAFAAEFSQMPIVFTNAMWTHYERLFRFMEARPNILVETSLFHTYRTIEDLIGRFGVERIVFGNGWKSHNGASIASLMHSEIDPQQREQIAHGNLERLLGIDKPLSASKPVIGDRLWHRLLRRERLGPEIIDAHAHISRGVEREHRFFSSLDAPIEHALRYMDTMGVRTMINAERYDYSADELSGMPRLEKHLTRYGERFRGFLSAFPFAAGNAENFVPHLDKIFSRSYYVGFKTHSNRWNVAISDPRFVPLWEYAHSRRLLILLHTWNNADASPTHLEKIVPRYPQATFILGHSGNVERPVAARLVKEHPNVHLEWCGSFMNPADWRETLDDIGNRRVVFGSDGVSWDEVWGHSPAWEMGRLLSMEVPDETLIPILGANMRRILEQRKGRV